MVRMITENYKAMKEHYEALQAKYDFYMTFVKFIVLLCGTGVSGWMAISGFLVPNITVPIVETKKVVESVTKKTVHKTKVAADKVAGTVRASRDKYVAAVQASSPAPVIVKSRHRFGLSTIFFGAFVLLLLKHMYDDRKKRNRPDVPPPVV